jgi:hypothetical protein
MLFHRWISSLDRIDMTLPDLVQRSKTAQPLGNGSCPDDVGEDGRMMAGR